MERLAGDWMEGFLDPVHSHDPDQSLVTYPGTSHPGGSQTPSTHPENVIIQIVEQNCEGCLKAGPFETIQDLLGSFPYLCQKVS